MIFDEFPYLENESLILKKPSIEDLPPFESMVKDKDVYSYEPTFLPELRSNSSREFLEKDNEALFERKECIVLGIYSKSAPFRFIGLAEIYGYSNRRSKVSIGYRLIKEVWNRGIGTVVVSILKDYIINQLDIKRITAHVRIENVASKKCLIKNGFVQRRPEHEEDWGYPNKIIAVKYVYYSDLDDLGAL